jgi:hypothetical protein
MNPLGFQLFSAILAIDLGLVFYGLHRGTP